MKKRFLALVLTGMMLILAAAGCSGTPDSTSQGGTESNGSTDGTSAADIKIGLTMSSRDQFLSSLEQAVINGGEAANVSVSSFDANNDIQTQLNHVQTCAVDGYDAMIVNLVDSTNAREIINAAGDMKVVFVNRSPDVSMLNENVMYVGSDENYSGSLQGQYLAAYANENGLDTLRIIMMQGTLGLDHTNKRTDSAIKALEDAGIAVDIVYQDTAEYDRSKAMEKFTQVLGMGNEIDAVICNNDDMALGCIEAYKAMGVTEIPIPIVGIDATRAGCDAVLEGTLAFTVLQDPVGQGAGAVECAIALVRGETIPDAQDFILWVPFEPVDAENAADYM